MKAIDEGVEFSVVVSDQEMQQRDVSGGPQPPLRLRFSKADGRLLDVHPPQPLERIRSELSDLVIEARNHAAHILKSAGHLKLTRLMATYLEGCRKNPKAIVLVRLKDNYEALMHHAQTVANALELPLCHRTNTYMCAISLESVDQARERLKERGYETVLTEYE